MRTLSLWGVVSTVNFTLYAIRMYMAMGEAVNLSKRSAVRGHHVYKAIWTPYVGQRHAVSVRKATYACATGPSTRGGSLTIQTFQTRKSKGGGGVTQVGAL